MGLRLLDGRRELALPDLHPRRVGGPSADGPDRARRRRAELHEFPVGESFNVGDPLQDALKECRFVFRPRFELWLKFRVVDWKAFAGPDKRVVFESGRLVGLKGSGEVDQTVARKELLDNFPAGVGGAAG